MRFANPYHNERGAALIISLMFLALLGLLGTTAVVLTTTDMRIGGNYKTNAQSFYDAEAGVNFAIAKMEEGLKANPPTFPSGTTLGDMNTGDTATLSHTVPGGFSFMISDITKIATNAYSFTSTGNGTNNSRTVIKATFEEAPAIEFVAFGDTRLDTKSGGTTLSYKSNSSDSTENNPADPSFQTTHEADVGSNDWLVTYNGVSIDGDGVFGQKDDGSATTDGINGGTIFYGTAPVNKGRIDPDPLGVNSGGEYDPATYITSNDNNNSSLSALSGSTSLSLNNGETMTLSGKPGGANYYLTDVELKNGSTLIIDATNGPVRLFLTGGLDAKNGSTISVEKGGSPTYDASNFSIFSNSTTKIDLKQGSSFTGLVYAPYADIDVKNSADVYGAIWGDTVDIKNSGSLYFDSALEDKYLSNNLSITTWEDVRR